MNQPLVSLHSAASRGELRTSAASIRPAGPASGAMGLRKRFVAPH